MKERNVRIGQIKEERTPLMFEDLPEWIYKCVGCASCQGLYKTQWPNHTFDPVCPIMDVVEYESGSPGGLLWLIRGSLQGIISWNTRTLEHLYSCSLCKLCELQCYGDHAKYITEIITTTREELVNKGITLPQVREFLENVRKYGNPWGQPISKRGNWAIGINGVNKYQPGVEYLYWVGCVGSYDPVGQRIARALAKLMVKAGVSFGILAEEEVCSGNDVKRLGERGLFELLVERNVKKFETLGVKKVVTLSPHSFNTFKNEYPQFGEVLHYTQLLLKLIKDGKLKLSTLKAKVTYHDPCFLGRYNDIYNEPREILQLIPGVTLVEMRRNRENAFCCGGGSGNFYLGLLNSKSRIKEAYTTGADILAVACPVCGMMLEDALKDEGLEGKMSVLDISEIVEKAVMS